MPRPRNALRRPPSPSCRGDGSVKLQGAQKSGKRCPTLRLHPRSWLGTAVAAPRRPDLWAGPRELFRAAALAAVIGAAAAWLVGCDQQRQQSEATASVEPGEPTTDVDLPIPNLSQQTPVWCWATVAQQIILAAKGPSDTPPQCALAAHAYGLPVEGCCSGVDPRCQRTGSLGQIQGLIEDFASRDSTTAGPADPAVLHRALAGGHAVIMGLNMAPGVGHVVVIRGMSFVPTAQGLTPMVHMNDPMAVYTQPVPFAAVAPFWRSAIIVN